MPNNTKKYFLQEFIKISSKIGINEEALETTSAKIYNHPKGYVDDFYFGISDVVREVESMMDEELGKIQEIRETKSITEKIRICLYDRALSQDHDFAKKLGSYYKSFKGMQQFFAAKASTCDYIWRIAGDKSLDFNYYSKRALLLGVYLSANREFIKSGNKESTKKTIDKGLEKVLKLSKFKPSIILEKIPFVRLMVK
ncbi:MAG: COQ9 family protein [Rickettsiaceae bacterium]|nr:COQ9 family protein [Rickettsiaceae bacterium]